LRYYFTAIDANLIDALDKELFKISIVSIRKYPPYIRAKKANSKDTNNIKKDVNQYRLEALESLRRHLKADKSYMAAFRKCHLLKLKYD